MSESPSSSKLNIQKIQPENDISQKYTKTLSSIQNSLKRTYDNNNILLLGGSSTGKTSLINSLYLALTNNQEELATDTPAFSSVKEITIYQRQNKTPKSGQITSTNYYKLKGTNINFWDTKGFENHYDKERLSVILQYILEGKVKPINYHHLLIQDKEDIIATFKNKSAHPFKAVIFIERENTNVDNNRVASSITLASSLKKAISSSNIIKNLPIFRVLNGCLNDHLTAEYNSKLSEELSFQKMQFGLSNRRFNLDTYTWQEIFNDFDSDCDEDPQGYMMDQTYQQEKKQEILKNKNKKLTKKIDKNNKSIDSEKSKSSDKIKDDNLDCSKSSGYTSSTESKKSGKNSDGNIAKDAVGEQLEVNGDWINLEENLDKNCSRFEYCHRILNEDLSREKNLSLLLFFDHVLKSIVNPEGFENKMWRMDRNVMTNNQTSNTMFNFKGLKLPTSRKQLWRKN